MGADDIPTKPETVAGNEIEDGILEAARDGDLEKLKERFKPSLAEHVSLRGSWQNTPLHIAAENDHVEIVRQLIEWNCDVNARNVLGNTPLHYAVMCGNTEVVKVLAGVANRDVPNNKQCTPLLLAVENEHEDILKILLDFKANPNIPDQSGNTPLHLAVNDHLPKMAEQLLLADCHKNLQNDEGDTPLHLAVNAEDFEMVDMLLEHGCDPTLHNTAHNRPIDVVMTMNGEVAHWIAERLKQAMARQGSMRVMTDADLYLIINEASIILNWAMLFRKLGVEDGDITEQYQKNYQTREKVCQLFTIWKNKYSKDATVEKFCTALKAENLNYQADILQDQFWK